MRWIGQITYDEVAYFREDVIIEAGNKLGIGTTSPAAALHVYGTTGIVSESPSNASITIRRNDNTNYGALLKYHTGNSEKWVAGLSDAGDFTDSTGVEYFIGTSKAAPKFLINSSGNVGIGTTSPQKTLDVAGGDIRLDNSKGIYFSTVDANIGRVSITGDESNDFIRLKVDNNNSHVINLNTTGVGVGTTSPASKLHVAGTVQVGVDDTGHDVKFFGATSGRYLLWDESSNLLLHRDNVKSTFGNASDLQIFHDASNSYIYHGGTGNLYIKNETNDQDVVLQCDDGSGGITAYLTLDGGLGRTTVQKNMQFADNAELWLGDGPDFKMFHDGSNTHLQQIGTGNLYIQNTTDNKDIIFQSDDGSGGVATYFALDGGYPSPYTVFPDNSRLAFGAGLDLRIRHSGSSSYIENYTGNLLIRNNQDDGDIIFQSDDGSGGVETYFFLDGSASSGNPITIFPDLSALYFGTGTDLMIRHDGTDSTIANNGGDLYITQNTNDKDIIFKSDDGSGGTTEYFRLDGSVGGGSTVHTVFPDNSKACFGSNSGGDTLIWHDGTNSYIKQQGGGDLIMQQSAADKDIILQSDDGSGGETAYLTLDGSAKTIEVGVPINIGVDDAGHDVIFYGDTAGYNMMWDTSSNRLEFTDNAKIYLGNGSDLQIYHTGSNSNIKHDGTGALIITQATDDQDIILKCDDGSGGTTAYLTLDGSRADGTYTYTTLPDSGVMAFGASVDMQLYHDATDSIIRNNTGDLKIINYADDKDIVFQSDDGSGGVETYFYLDGSSGGANPMTIFPDDSRLSMGTGVDLHFKHNGTNSYIENETGDLYITQDADDKDIILKSDDGSGGTTAYLTLDGGLGYITVQKRMQLQNSVGLYLGTSTGDLIYHNGSNTFWTHQVGDLTIESNQDDGDIIFKSDDGSGGLDIYFYLDGGNTNVRFEKDIFLLDNVNLRIGSGTDLEIYNDGTDSYLHVDSGDLIIEQTADDKDIIFKSDDGSGGLETYFFLDGSTGYTQFPDSKQLAFGSDNDMRVYSSGSTNFIISDVGDLSIQQKANDKDIIFKCDDGSGGTTAYLTLDGSAGHTKAHKEIQFEDNVIARFGAGNDMAIRHTGSHSYVSHDGTGNLYIDNTADDAETIFRCDDGSGGTTAYLTLDGRNEEVVFSKPIVTAETQIKILPHQFMSNEDGGANKSAQFRDDTIIGVRSSADSAELYAFVEIPYGKTATNVTVYGNDASLAVNVYESDINAGALTDKTPGAGCVVGDVCDITDVAYSATNYLAIKVTTVSYTNDIVYGAVVTIT